jgi:hypothetical protein
MTDMRERGPVEIGIPIPPTKALGGYFFNRNNGNFSTGIDTERVYALLEAKLEARFPRDFGGTPRQRDNRL